MTKKPNARTFGQDLMRGEHIVGDNKANRAKHGKDAPQTEDLRGGLSHRTTMDPYRAKGTAPNVKPGGGGGQGAWLNGADDEASSAGTSIFDPVLTELCYRWFCPPKGRILDPFAGGSVRGVVASHLGRAYTGIDLRPEQLEANRAQLDICKDPKPVWVEGDSRDIAKLLDKGDQFDFVFSCPPYWNLEVYSEDKRDLSTLGADEFFTAQAAIVRAACARLKNNRFAGWIVGDVRDAKGLYVNLPGRSVQAFEDAGLRLYNEAILITAAGSLAMRAGKQFTGSRKLGKSHQNVLIFVKGDPVKATQAIGDVEFGDIEAAEGAPAAEAAPAAPAARSTPAPGSADLASYGEVL